MVKLGQKVRDKVTGFTGIAIIEAEHLYGCNQFGVAPEMNEKGEIKDAEWFDEGRLEFISQAVDTSNGGIPEWTDTVGMGNEAKDKVTGFKGIVTTRARYLFGALRYGLTPKTNADGEVKPAEWFDIKRIEAINQGIKPQDVQGEKRGGSLKDLPRAR